jgi:hypothetical protein
MQRMWPQVPGVIVSSNVQLMRVYVPDIEYRFSFEGREYLARQVSTLELGTGWSAPARRLVEQFPVGKEVTVFVDPTNPTNSVLVPGGDRKFMPFVAAIAGLVIYVGLRLVAARI